MTSHFKLSKSRLLAYRQCPRRLWLQTHRPELAMVDTASAAWMASGSKAGEVFRSLHPEGILIDTDDLGEALRQTRTLLASQPLRPLFEATLEAGDVLVRIDLLTPDQAGYRLVEAKSSTSVKDYHLDDAAIQTWVAQAAGLSVTGTAIAHIDREFVYPGQQRYQGFFAETRIDREIAARLPLIAHWVKAAQAMLTGQEPDITPGEQCDQPFSCPFLLHCQAPCHDDGQPAVAASANYPVSILPRSQRLVEELKREGYADLREVPEERLENERQRTVWRATQSGQAIVGEEIRSLARALPYPRYYLDFETIAFAAPRWAGTRPYQQVPFQFSCHTEIAPGIVLPAAYLDCDGNDPRRDFAETLIATVDPAKLAKMGLDAPAGVSSQPGPILVYNAAFERSRISELAAVFPDLAPALHAVNARLLDLLPLTRAHYYHPAMHGSWSLKAVLPTIEPGLAYEGMAVANGGDAQAAYLELISPETSAERRAVLCQGLLDYCALDTYGLLRLVAFFAGEN